MQSARDNIKDPPGIYLKVGLESLRGTLRFINDDLPRAFGDLGDLHLLGDLADASTEAVAAIDRRCIDYLEKDLAPRSKGSFRLGPREVRAEVPAGRRDRRSAPTGCCAIALARAAGHAGRVPPRRVAPERRRPDGRVAAVQSRSIRPPDSWCRSRSSSSPELQDFIARQRIITIPRGSSGRRPADAAVLSLDLGQHVDTRARSRSRAQRAFYYITDVDPLVAERSARPSTCATSATARSGRSPIHEVFPGHFLHYQHLRQIDSKLRKSILFSSTAFVEGWAHYCEQMMVDEGFRKSRSRRSASGSSPRRWSASAGPLSASGCTARTCRSSRVSGSSVTRRFWKK